MAIVGSVCNENHDAKTVCKQNSIVYMYVSNAHAGQLPIYVADKNVQVILTTSYSKGKKLNPLYKQLLLLSIWIKQA